MGKSTHFLGQPLYSQVLNLLSKDKILQISRENGGEHYVKRFDGWTHLVVMLYAVIMRFDYGKFEELTQRRVIYVTNMKKNLKYKVMNDTMYQTPEDLMEVRIQHVVFTKLIKGGEKLTHQARLITYVDERKHRLV